MKDESVLEAARRQPCEMCGHRPPSDPHHLMTRGAGQVDIPENVASLCRVCHVKVGADVREANKLWATVEKRTGLTKQEIQVLVWEMRRQPKGAS